MSKKIIKIKPEDLSKLLGNTPKKKKKIKKEEEEKSSIGKAKKAKKAKKKKVKKKVITSSKVIKNKNKKKKKITGNSKVAEILKAKKGPSSVVAKTGIEAEEEFQKWLATEPGFLEGLTSDVLGNPTKLYYYQIKYIKDKAFFIHIDKSRQCLPKGSIVNTPLGPVCIEDLKPGDPVYSFNIKTQKVEVDEVKDAWESGIRQCRRVFFEDYPSVETGEIHPFLSLDYYYDFKWKKNKDLEYKDSVVTIPIGILYNSNFYFEHNTEPCYDLSTVLKTEETEKKLCYDISVKKNENFLFEGLVVHNTGFSYVYACRSLARSHLSQHHTSIFISINQEEANEKIAYSRALYESLPNSIRKKCVVDNKHSLEFEASNGNMSSRTRIISYAQREPRGKGGNVDVYLDEAAHYTWGEQIYVAAVPIITRGTGTLTIGSSPLGKKGIHYDIIAKDAYKRIYSYHQVYWWQCIDFVKRGKFKEANKECVHLSTEQRVAKYGSEKIIGIFISMDLEQFQQEYELLHIDESVSFFPIDLINKCVYEVVIDDIFSLEDEYSEKLTFPIVEKFPEINFRLYDQLEDLASAINSGKVDPRRLFSGYDVGRKQNAGEFSIIEEVNNGGQPLQIIRHLQTFKNKKFKYQKAYLKRALDLFPGLKMKIDSGGMGEDMAEELADYSWRVEPIHFTNDWKEEICADFRIRLEEQLIGIPNRKDIKNQIHSIKRKVTESGRFIFDAEKNKNHHGDIYWSVAMASSFGERVTRTAIRIPSLRRVILTPKIIPINTARSFQKVDWPTVKMPIGVGNLKGPSEIGNLHRKIANL